MPISLWTANRPGTAAARDGVKGGVEHPQPNRLDLRYRTRFPIGGVLGAPLVEQRDNAPVLLHPPAPLRRHRLFLRRRGSLQNHPRVVGKLLALRRRGALQPLGELVR
jgi:hypothetical protein